MTLNKAIAHGKERRKPYGQYAVRGYSHGCVRHPLSCPRCANGKLFKRRRDEAAADEQIREFFEPADDEEVYGV